MGHSAFSSRCQTVVLLSRAARGLLLLSVVSACAPGDRVLAPADVHRHDLRYNLTTRDDSVYRWSDPSAWPAGVVPRAGDDAIIPAGRRILLDTTPPALRRIAVLGTLSFDDTHDLELSARTIDVLGMLEIGTAKRRFAHRAVITLTGSASEQQEFGAGGKGIIVAGGTLELHGARVVSWTRLGAHAPSGSSTIELEREVSWRVGDHIAISATGFDPSESEERQIVGIEGATVHLARPLTHSHWGVRQVIAGRTLDERAEVALLSRNVVIRGDSASAVTGFGAQVMIHPGSIAHVEGTEFVRVGQRGKLGRYPLHWHLARDTEGHYARDNAVWQSYNRCMTIHGTNGVTLERNVCYDHVGHGFFLEDGVERGNVLAGNLGMRTRAPEASERLLPSDERPATFWVTNPDNDLHDNVAAGSDGFGIWYALPEYPTGLSATRNVRPRHEPLGRFDRNTVHSNVRSGLWVDEGTDASGALGITWYEPRQNGATGAVAPAIFRRLTAYKNQALGAWFRGSNMHLIDATLADNMSGAVFAATESSLEKSFVVGVSENRGVNPRAWAPVRGFWFYDGPVGVSRTLFANFDARAGADASALGFHPVNPWPISGANWVEGLQFEHATRVAFDAVLPGYDATKSAIVLDRDGSLSGRATSSIVPDAPLLRDGCAEQSPWRAWACATPFAQLVVRSDQALPQGLDVRRALRAESRVAVSPVRYDSTFTSLTVPLDVLLEARTPGRVPLRLELMATAMPNGSVLDVTFPDMSRAQRVSIGGSFLPQATPDSLDHCTSCWGIDAASGGVRVRVRSATAGGSMTYGEVFVTIERGASGGSLSAGRLPPTRIGAAAFAPEALALPRSGQRPEAGGASSVLK